MSSFEDELFYKRSLMQILSEAPGDEDEEEEAEEEETEEDAEEEDDLLTIRRGWLDELDALVDTDDEDEEVLADGFTNMIEPYSSYYPY